VLSALADGEARAEDLALLRPHMRTCLSCRAALREFRAMPDRVASVLPPAALAADGGGPLRSFFESVVGAAQHKAAAMGDRLQTAAELATGQKVAAVAASAAALAGGGTAIDEFANHEGPPLPAPVQQVEAQPVKEKSPVEPAPPPSAEAPPAHPAPAPEPADPPAPELALPPPDPANEFAPGAGAVPAASEPSAPASPPGRPAGGEFTSNAGDGSGGGGGAGEFAP
jgi:hypothetical protein